MSKRLFKKSITKVKIHKIQNNNGFQYNMLKAIEELSELSAALTQMLTKNNKDTVKNVIEEFGDVEFRLSVLRSHFNEKLIDKRFQKKLNKSIKYLKTQKYDKV